MPKIKAETDGTVEGIVLTVDGKEISKLHGVDFMYSGPGDYPGSKGYLTITWATREKMDDGMVKRTTFSYNPNDNEEASVIDTTYEVDRNSFKDRDLQQYLITGKAPDYLTDKMDENPHIELAVEQ